MEKKQTAKAFMESVDKQITEQQGKVFKHHETKITGTAQPTEWVIFEDGSEIPYPFADEKKLHELRKAELLG